MPDTCWDVLVRVMAAAIFAVLLIGLSLLLRRWVSWSWWPSLLFQAGQRPAVAQKWLLISFLVPSLPLFMLLGGGGLAIGVLGWILGAPAFVGRRIARAAWAEDDNATHEQARELRNEINQRRGLPDLPSPDGPWRYYVIDAALTKRRARYRPPGDDGDANQI